MPIFGIRRVVSIRDELDDTLEPFNVRVYGMPRIDLSERLSQRQVRGGRERLVSKK